MLRLFPALLTKRRPANLTGQPPLGFAGVKVHPLRKPRRPSIDPLQVRLELGVVAGEDVPEEADAWPTVLAGVVAETILRLLLLGSLGFAGLPLLLAFLESLLPFLPFHLAEPALPLAFFPSRSPGPAFTGTLHALVGKTRSLLVAPLRALALKGFVALPAWC